MKETIWIASCQNLYFWDIFKNPNQVVFMRYQGEALCLMCHRHYRLLCWVRVFGGLYLLKVLQQLLPLLLVPPAEEGHLKAMRKRNKKINKLWIFHYTLKKRKQTHKINIYFECKLTLQTWLDKYNDIFKVGWKKQKLFTFY